MGTNQPNLPQPCRFFPPSVQPLKELRNGFCVNFCPLLKTAVEIFSRYMNDAPEIIAGVELDGDHITSITVNGDDQSTTADFSNFTPISPSTPVSNQVSADVKIDIDYEGHESDARNEPLTVEFEEEAAQNVSSVGQAEMDAHSSMLCSLSGRISFISFLGSVPPQTPIGTNGTTTPSNDVNDVHDIVMEEHTPATTPDISGSFSTNGASTAHTTPNDVHDDDDDKPPPSKRQRVHSDADQASSAHVSFLFL
jgi:hypothetical protein